MTCKPFVWKECVLRNAVKNSSSAKETLLSLGLSYGGGHYIKFYQKVGEFDIDVSHFTSKKARKVPEIPHEKLVPYLDKYNITWDSFSKRGRVPKCVKAKRMSIITEIHSLGTTWDEMIEISGMSLGFVARNTNACGNSNSCKNLQENGRATGRIGKGRVKPELSEQMKKRWEDGVFDCHKGRVVSDEERSRLKEFWSDSDRRRAASDRMKLVWADPLYRDRLMQFHTSESERIRRSEQQVNNLKNYPKKWSRGQGCHVPVSKCEGKLKLFVRSSYEKAAITLLEGDDNVISYQYEKRLNLLNGRWILPDFLITYRNRKVLVEVKASWVLSQPEDAKEVRRLKLAEDYASSQGWDFEIWTEKDRLKDVI
jgi:hypothetical protein